METDWMGRYRPLVAALVLHTNITNRGSNERMDVGKGVLLTTQEWQTLECIVEHEESYFSMIEIARRLGIPQSSFSRTVKTLYGQKLIEKYQVEGNRKNVILRPSEFGREIYINRVEDDTREMFISFFRDLDSISDKDLETFTSALNRFSRSLPSAKDSQEVKLRKID